ncbi:MAG: O-antigen ligase family protein [Lachnospiraceae bacterium]|nr:O-antigen ligase family protein [Lachnospiraceae bacterium]
MIKKAGNLFVTAYLLLIFCVYPFYMKEGYVDMGEGKYEFFLYCSLGALLILAMIALLRNIQVMAERYRLKEAYLIDWEKIKISSTDVFVLMYLGLISFSGLLSDFRREALWGADGWHMGLILWAVLCVLYFFVSRFWEERKWMWYAAFIASAVVFFLGIGDSFSFYLIPLPVREAGFISTLGNINWFCGYLSVLAPIGICFWFFRETSSEENKMQSYIWKAVCPGIYTVLAFIAGLCQGSNSVFLWFGGLFFVLLWIGVSKAKWLVSWFFMVFLWGLSAQMIRLLRVIFPGKYNYELNNLCGFFTETNLSLWIGLAGLVCWAVMLCLGKNRKDTENWEIKEADIERKNQEKGTADITRKSQEKRITHTARKILAGTLLGSILLWAVLSAVNTWTDLSGFLDAGLFLWNESWGNGRGAALKAGFRMFGEMSFVQKLIGVGPDCFASYAYSIDEVAVSLREYFGGSRLTNAHCELITSFINVGVLGTLCYVGIFVSFIRRCFLRGAEKPLLYMPAVCAICYLCHNVVSFAQVLNLPFVILVVAMGERMLRNVASNK